MKKILVVLLVVFLGVAMLTSCGETKEETATTDPATTTDVTTTDPAATTTDPAATTTDPATTDMVTGTMEINELTLTPATGWKGEAMKESGMITLNTETGSALTLITVENMNNLTIDAYTTAQKDTLKSFGDIKEEKANYGGLDYTKLEYSVGGNTVVQMNALAKNFFVMITINGGVTPEVEGMLNSIVIK